VHKDCSQEKQSEKSGGNLTSGVAGSLDSRMGYFIVNFLKQL